MITLSHPINNIKQIILSNVGRDMKAYHFSAFKALQNECISIYHFSLAHNYTNALQGEYKEKVFRIFTDNTLDFSDSELNAIYRYYSRSPVLTMEECNDIEAKLVDSLADWNAYRNRLLKSTERIRSALDNSSVKLINIDVQKYIEYWKVFKQDSSEDILLKNLYTLGYLAGKQAEQKCD